MFRLLLLLLLIGFPSVCLSGPKKGKGEAKVAWTEYQAEFVCNEGSQPTVIIQWFSMNSDGSYREYPEIWRKGMKFGYGERFRVESLSGVDQDGKRKKGQVVEAAIIDTKTNQKILFRSDNSTTFKSYTEDWMKQHVLKSSDKKQPEPAK